MWTSPKFLIAMTAYCMLAFAAWRTLDTPDHQILWFTWFVLAVCAIKTVVDVLRRRLD